MDKMADKDYLNPLKGWREGWWDPLRATGARLYDLDAAILGEEAARQGAEGGLNLYNLLAPHVAEEPIATWPSNVPGEVGIEKVLGKISDPYYGRAFPKATVPPSVDLSGITEEEWAAADPFSRPTVVPTKPIVKRPVTKKTPTTKRAYVDIPGPAMVEPPLGAAPSRKGWPLEAYGITPEPPEEKVPFLRKLLTGKGTLTGIPYILPILAALSESPQGGRFLQMWSGMRGRKLAAQEADLARLQHVYDTKIEGLARGIPLSLGDRKRLAAIDPTLLRKHLVSKEVTYRYNRKAKKYMTEEEIAEKGVNPDDLGDPVTRVEKSYDWIIKPEGPEYRALRTEKGALAVRKYRAKIMDKEFETAYGRDYVKSDAYKKLRADYIITETLPGAKWINVDGGTALFDPKTNTTLASYIDPNLTSEARMRLRTKYQKQLIDHTAKAEQPKTMPEALELMTKIKRSINLDYNNRLTALANRAKASRLDPNMSDKMREAQSEEIRMEMRALIQEQRDILAALDREFSKNTLLADLFKKNKGGKVIVPTGEKEELFTSQLEKAARAKAAGG